MLKLLRKKIGIVGLGNMGLAIAERIKSNYNVFVFDKDKEKTKNISGIGVAGDALGLVNKSEVIILAVKPQDFDSVLNEIQDVVKDKLIISIAAGITTGYIEKFLPDARVIRIMPNIGAKIGKAESSLCKGKNAKDQDLDFARELFNMLGKTWVIKEEMINAATAISGSGPAYIYYDMQAKKIDADSVTEEIKQEYIQRLKKAAEKVGFDSETALDLAASTTASSLALSKITAPADLIKKISSQGGTTEAALKILAEGGSWEEAAKAAVKRAKELSKP
jgi:pyrroline-5-carboxylate reductase